MKIAEQVSAKRLACIMKKDALETRRQALITIGAVFAAFLAIYLVSGFVVSRGLGADTWQNLSPGRDPVLHWVLFSLLLFPGGFIVTSRAFYDVHNRVRNHDWFMLPASPVEKFAEKLLLTSFGYGVFVLLGYALFSVIAAGLSALFFKYSFELFNPLDRAVLLSLLNYVVAQSVFLLGAAYFRKNHFLKTVLAIAGLGLLFALCAAVIFRLVYGKFFNGLVPTDELGALFEGLDAIQLGPRLERAGKVWMTISKAAYWGLLAPVLWVIAYLRIREAEVKDGV